MAFRAVNAAGVPTGCCYSHASKSMLFNRHAGGAFVPTEQMPVSPYELICVKVRVRVRVRVRVGVRVS